ncbi:MAG: type 1 glutamine amidotransferase [Pseudomonadota bacterium]
MKIGILQTGHVPDDLTDMHGRYPDMFAALLDGHDFTFEAFPVVDNIFPDGIHAAEGWLITGSKHGAYEDHIWIPPLEDFIRKAYAAMVPMAGICFGHQIMAQALGGKVEKFGGIWGVGNLEYTHSDGTRSRLYAMHQDQVVELPKDAIVTATSDVCENAAISYKGKAMSIQPHPEFTKEFIEELINLRAGTVIPMEQADAGMKSLEYDHDSLRVGDQIAAFFKEAVTDHAV